MFNKLMEWEIPKQGVEREKTGWQPHVQAHTLPWTVITLPIEMVTNWHLIRGSLSCEPLPAGISPCTTPPLPTTSFCLPWIHFLLSTYLFSFATSSVPWLLGSSVICTQIHPFDQKMLIWVLIVCQTLGHDELHVHNFCPPLNLHSPVVSR